VGAVYPGQALAATKVQQLCAAAKGVQKWTRAAEAPAEAPEAGQVQGFGAPQGVSDDSLDIAIAVCIVQPQGGVVVGAVAFRLEADRLVGVVALGLHLLIDGESGFDVAGADREEHGKAGLVIGHSQSPEMRKARTMAGLRMVDR